MRKLTLDIDALNVQSFETRHAGRAEQGTVLGHDATNRQCDGSEVDACPSARGCTLFDCNTRYCTAAECAETYTCDLNCV